MAAIVEVIAIFTVTAVFLVPSEMLVVAIIPAASMAWKKTTGAGEQSDNTYYKGEFFHIL